MPRFMKMLFSNVFLMDQAADGGGGAAAGGGGDAGAAGGAPAGNDTLSSGSGADPAQGGAGQPAAGGQDTADGGQQAKFPDNWREGLAGGDPRKVERLSRYGTPQAVADALVSVQERISKGELRSNVPFPEKGTDQEKAAWRAEQGIPAKADEYFTVMKLSGNKTIDEADKPKMSILMERMHAANATPAQTAAAVEAYYAAVEDQTNRRLEQDRIDVENTRDSMVAKMGLPEFKANYNLVTAMFDMVPAKVKDVLMYGRLANGKPILGDPDVFEGLTQWARAINPAGALVPNAGGNTAGAIEDEIASIEKDMRTDRAAYNKDEKKQERYRQLLEARDRANPKK